METLVHRETLADIYVRDDGSAVVHDYAPRPNPWFALLLALPIVAVIVYFPVEARFGWEVALAVLACSAIGPLVARRLKRHVRGTKRSERIFSLAGVSAP